jgi:NTP pyrophosphatase (non-canonical NTP hydrolase)
MNEQDSIKILSRMIDTDNLLVLSEKEAVKKAINALYGKDSFNCERKPVEKTIKNLCLEAFETAKSKGWHDQPRSFGEFISLVHAEVSEALEADRRNEGKERVAEELGDVLIRIFDGSIEFGLDIETAILTKMAYNRTRSYKHGGKKY